MEASGGGLAGLRSKCERRRREWWAVPTLQSWQANAMKTRNVYLDADVYGHLGNHVVQRLAAQIDSGALRIFGSFELFEEIVVQMERRGRVPALLDRFWALVRDRIIRPRTELFPMELRKGAQLSLCEAMSSPDIVQAAREHAQCTPQRLAMFENADVLSRETCEELNSLRVSAAHQLRIEHRTPSSVYKFVSQDVVNAGVFDDWHEHVFRNFKDQAGDPAGPWKPPHRTPITRAYAAIMRATLNRVHLNVDTGRFWPGDRTDWLHFAYASIPGTLVTDDGQLRRTAELLQPHLVKVLSLKDFVESEWLG